MAEPFKVYSLGIEQTGRMYLFSYEDGPLADGQFRVETLYSGVSAGTELTFLKGSNPYLHSRWDDYYKVFVPGEPAVHFPMPFLGYMEVGRVIESRTPAVANGDIAAMAYGHKTGHTANPSREFFFPVPPELDPMLGIYIAQMGPICANGLLHAAEDLIGPAVQSVGDGVRGRNVLVMGAGVIGLLTGLFARLHGAADILIADPSSYRREVAGRLQFLSAVESEAWRVCKERWKSDSADRGADVAFQCRAHSASLHSALRALRPQGTVIDMAFYQGGAADLCLGEEFHHNGLSIRCAQIGRVPRRLSFLWDRARLARETLNLLRAEGRAILDHVVSEVVPFEEAPEFLSGLANHRRDFLQIVLRIGP
jgi:hypothetical protein